MHTLQALIQIHTQSCTHANARSNTLVCDGVDEARDLAYGRGERHKVVSKDGTLFNKVRR